MAESLCYPDEAGAQRLHQHRCRGMADTAVIYLARKGNHPRFSRAFLHSLIACPAGADFDLVYLLKGYGDGESDPNLAVFRGAIPHAIHELRCLDENFATNVVLDAAAGLHHQRIMFLTSYSRILAPGWMAAYLDAFERTPSCGIVGATGGFEVIPGTTFPNVNVRHNACLLERKLFLDIDPGPLKTKLDGNRLEAGPNSMTRQIINRRLAPVIVDRFGKAWGVEDWPRSRTFRSGRQEGLLIADNRTHDYDVARPGKRRRLAVQNWGEQANVTRVSMFARLASALRWRFPSTPPPAGQGR